MCLYQGGEVIVCFGEYVGEGRKPHVCLFDGIYVFELWRCCTYVDIHTPVYLGVGDRV